jgi:hypothetical protein
MAATAAIPRCGRREAALCWAHFALTELHFPEHLPAILIGVNGAREANANELPWAHRVHHQHGGYACLQSQLYGVILPLLAVPACSRLMLGFDALALDSPSTSAFARFPELESVHLTAGQPYEPAAIHALQRFLARAELAFPVITGGTEALLEFATASPTQFLGWPLLMLEMPAACELDDPDAGALEIGPIGVYPGRVLSPAALDRLRHVTREELRVYLLWDNSD